jgi:aryl-alcohol dehydrogenase-like predicted oxidoreductase
VLKQSLRLGDVEVPRIGLGTNRLSRTPQHLQENLGALEIELDDDDFSALGERARPAAQLNASGVACASRS